MEVLAYAPWQKRAALVRLALGLVTLGFLLWLGAAFVAEGEWAVALFLGIVALFLGLFLYPCALGPLWRSGFHVVLEPEGIRVEGRLYPRELFRSVEGPFRKGKDTEARWYALTEVGRFSTAPLFYLSFGQERVPLWLDLPGWDRLLAHLGVDWKGYPGLVRYLHSVRGMGWLNGLLYPPAEALGEWEKARERYRRLFAWLWAGVGLVVVGLAFEALLPAGLAVAVLGVGMALGLYAFFALFGGKSSRDGWAERYNPFGEEV